jgi:hypothetical protein
MRGTTCEIDAGNKRWAATRGTTGEGWMADGKSYEHRRMRKRDRGKR